MLKKGDTFKHRHWLDPDTKKPLVCEVTKIANGVIYYRCLYSDGSVGKTKAYFPIEQQEKYAMSREKNPSSNIMKDAKWGDYMIEKSRKGGGTFFVLNKNRRMGLGLYRLAGHKTKEAAERDIENRLYLERMAPK